MWPPGVSGPIRGKKVFLRPLQRCLILKAWAEYVAEWAAKDPYGFLTTVILALSPLFLASAVLPWKLAKMIEAREKEQKKKQKRQENIAKAKRLKKD
ncbi:small integral membrane protein 15-like [Choloepus didactylus]|uniref:small integral membrane protein 15-like n=1 Tax=Choloepus didactylus TaxID=27675 RepID=UPI00189E712A|nr:small integral membrane protein 15-like [Choloepus didactylus]